MKAINAMIESADVALVYDGRFLDFPIGLQLAKGGYVVFGGALLCRYHDDDCTENYAGKYICKIFDIVGVKSASELVVGKPVRAIFEKDAGLGDRVIGIQNFIDYKKYFITNERIAKKINEEELLQL